VIAKMKKESLEVRLLNYAITALLSIVSIIGSYGVHLISDMAADLKGLNVKMAVIMTQTADQKEGLASMDRRVKALESAASWARK